MSKPPVLMILVKVYPSRNRGKPSVLMILVKVYPGRNRGKPPVLMIPTKAVAKTATLPGMKGFARGVIAIKKYDIFLFDADDTLYDYTLSTAHALKSMFEQCNFNYTAEIQARYGVINLQAWASYEKGEISIDEMQSVRFARLFEEMGVYHDANDFNTRYLYELGKGMFLLDGAVEIFREIASHNKQIYIVTNGLKATQESRAKYSPLNEYITGFFIASEVGHQKPCKEFFEHVFKHIPTPKENMLIIGDSLTADVEGGNNAGIDTCWLNTHDEENNTHIKPTYEIKNLHQLKSFI